jgi:fatty acid desaturase
MNFHIDHHMYAAVPCYNLSKLHAAIKHDLPHCPVGLVETWKEIITIVKQQQIDPTYQYVAELPAPRAV